MAERNEKTAEKFASQGLKVTANEYYTRAADFYREAAWPQPVTESRMLPTYKKARAMFDKTWDRSRVRRSSRCRSIWKARCSTAISASPAAGARQEVSRGHSVSRRGHHGRSDHHGRRRVYPARHGLPGRRFSRAGRRVAA